MKLFGIVFAVGLIVAGGMTGNGVAWGQSVSSTTSAELPSARVLSRYGLERAWWGHATLNPKRDKLKYIVLDEENVYLHGTNGTVTAFNADSGQRLWAIQLGNRDEPVFPGVSNDRYFLSINGMTLYCIERFSGDLVWELRLPAMPSVSPSVDEDHIYVGTLDGSMYSFELKKIDKLYQQHLLPQWSNQALRWRYRTGKEISTPAVSTGRLVSFASRDNSLYSVGLMERKLTWQFETDAPISAPFATTEDSLVLASEDFYVYCLNRENGLVRWEFASGLPIRQAPRVIDNDVYVIPDRGGLFNLSMASGHEKWWHPNLVEFLAATKNRLFASDPTGNVVILQRSNGRTLGTLPMRGFNVRFQNDRTDRVFMATSNGLIVCLREQGAEFATFHRYPERAPLIPEVEPDENAAPAPDGAAAEPKENAEQ